MRMGNPLGNLVIIPYFIADNTKLNKHMEIQQSWLSTS